MKKARKNRKAAPPKAAISAGTLEGISPSVFLAIAIAIVVLLVFKGVALNSFVNLGR